MLETYTHTHILNLYFKIIKLIAKLLTCMNIYTCEGKQNSLLNKSDSGLNFLNVIKCIIYFELNLNLYLGDYFFIKF